MKIGFYQFDCKFGQKEDNREKVRKTFEDKEFEIMVLPELFSTGYFFRDPQEALEMSEEIPEGETTDFLIELANKHQAYIIGGVAEKGEDKPYSSAVVVGPEGYIGHHRKINLTGFEQEIFAPGKGINIFNLGEIKIGLAICYDLWFPELTRIFLHHGVQLICHPANFGGPMSPVIARARAIENVMNIVTANRVGTEKGPDGDETFRGESLIVGPSGKILARAERGEEIVIKDIKISLPQEKPVQLGGDLFNQIRHYSPGNLEIKEWGKKA